MAINGSSGWSGQSPNNTSIAAATKIAVKVQMRVDAIRALGANTSAGILQIATSANASVKLALFYSTDGAGNVTFKVQYPGQGTVSATAITQAGLPANGSDIEIYADLDGVGNAQHIAVFDSSHTSLTSATGANNWGALVTGTSGAVLLNDTNVSTLSPASMITGVGIYNVLLTGAAQSSAPASGDTGIVQLSKFTDASSGTTPNPSVATVGQNITMAGTWAYANDGASGSWFGTPPITVTVGLASSGSLGGTATETFTSTVAEASSGTIGGSSTETISGTGAEASMGSIGSTSTETISGTGAEASSGSLGASATQTTGVTTALASSGSLGAIAVETFVAAAIEAGAGSLSAAILQSIGVQGNLFGSGLLSAIAQELLDAPATMAGMSSISAFGTVANPVQCVVTLFGGGSLASAIALALPTTASTYLLTQAIRTQLLNYVRWDGANLATMLQNPTVASPQPSLYEVQAPDAGPYPYGVFRLVGRRRRSDVRWLMDCQIEIDFYMRPRASTKVVQDLGDVAEEALYAWKDPTSGIYIHSIDRELMNFQSAPADRDVVREHLVANAMVPLLYLTAGQDVVP